MKKIILSLIATSLSVGADAAVSTAAAPFQVVVPNLKSATELTVEGLYWRPSNADLTYVYTQTGGATNTLSANPNYNFGFRAGLGYVFPNSGNDLQLNWTHFNHDSTDSIVSGAGTLITTPLGFSSEKPLSKTQTVKASSKTAFHYDSLDLDVGQYLSMGSRFQSRLFAGLRYAQLKNNLADSYLGLDSTAPASSLTDVEIFNSKFRGLGPRFGIDTSYNVSNGLGVATHVALAVLVGQVESATTQTVTQVVGGKSTASVRSFNADKQTRLVPAFDAKLGIDYTVPFRNDASRMTVEAGYQVTQYVNAISRSYMDTTKNSGVGFNGPYLSLNFNI